MDFAEFTEADRRRRQAEQDERVRQSIAAFGPLTGTAYGNDRSVRVEVTVGGRLRAVEIGDDALRRGAVALRSNILAAARKATSRANHRAQQAFGRAMGDEGRNAAEALGLHYDPKLLDDDDNGRWP